jgi:hypothetical protein
MISPRVGVGVEKCTKGDSDYDNIFENCFSQSQETSEDYFGKVIPVFWENKFLCTK